MTNVTKNDEDILHHPNDFTVSLWYLYTKELLKSKTTSFFDLESVSHYFNMISVSFIII